MSHDFDCVFCVFSIAYILKIIIDRVAAEHRLSFSQLVWKKNQSTSVKSLFHVF